MQLVATTALTIILAGLVWLSFKDARDYAAFQRVEDGAARLRFYREWTLVPMALYGLGGVALLAIAGNIVTAWSWFGTNMLGVGLHSYGFMDKAFPWLLGFVIAQGLLILLTRLPAKCWRSFRNAAPKEIKEAGFEVNPAAVS